MSSLHSADRIEIEAKFKVASHEAIRARLIELGATRTGRVLETNHIFDDAVRSLLAGQRGLRVRDCRNDKGEFVSAMLTYKGPPLPGAAKQRLEIETNITDPDAARDLLTALGFVEVIRFQKRRETWEYHDMHIELDELPQLGCYVEIEAPSLTKLNGCEQALGLSNADAVPDTYVALVARACKASSQDPLTFAF